MKNTLKYSSKYEEFELKWIDYLKWGFNNNWYLKVD